MTRSSNIYPNSSQSKIDDLLQFTDKTKESVISSKLSGGQKRLLFCSEFVGRHDSVLGRTDFSYGHFHRQHFWEIVNPLKAAGSDHRLFFAHDFICISKKLSIQQTGGSWCLHKGWEGRGGEERKGVDSFGTRKKRRKPTAMQ